jgi:hypothetical protein
LAELISGFGGIAGRMRWRALLARTPRAAVPTKSVSSAAPQVLLSGVTSMDFRFRDGRGAFEKVEVASCVRLLYVLHEKAAVPSRIDPFSRPPSCASEGEFFVADSHVQLTGGNIKVNDIAFFQQRQRAAYETLR